jgi:hypothetical protein
VAALVLAGVPVRSVLVPMADHGFDVRPGGFDVRPGGFGEQLARGLVLDFLRDVMR